MLGKTAGGLFWMFRYLERSENTARTLEAGFRIALTRSSAEEEWASIVTTSGMRSTFLEHYDDFNSDNVIDFLLRDKKNPSSVIVAIEAARNNARLVRTALTREVWEAVNETWITLSDALSRTIRQKDLPNVLGLIRRQSALVRGSLHGTMLRNDVFDFPRLGTYIERADNTARILDVKYHVLLPSVSLVGSTLDNIQWETILRSVAAHQSFKWLHDGELSPTEIAKFLILDNKMPRSLAFCVGKIVTNLDYLGVDYDLEVPCHTQSRGLKQRLLETSIEGIFDNGLHEFLTDFIADVTELGRQIEVDYRFTE